MNWLRKLFGGKFRIENSQRAVSAEYPDEHKVAEQSPAESVEIVQRSEMRPEELNHVPQSTIQAFQKANGSTHYRKNHLLRNFGQHNTY